MSEEIPLQDCHRFLFSAGQAKGEPLKPSLVYKGTCSCTVSKILWRRQKVNCSYFVQQRQWPWRWKTAFLCQVKIKDEDKIQHGINDLRGTWLSPRQGMVIVGNKLGFMSFSLTILTTNLVFQPKWKQGPQNKEPNNTRSTNGKQCW